MNPMVSLMFLGATLLLSAVAIGVAVFFFQRYSNPEPSLLQQRLIGIKSKQNSETNFEENEKYKKLARLYKEAEYKNENLGKKLEQLAIFRAVKLRLQQAGIRTPADKFFMNNMVIPIVLLVVLGVVSGFFILSLAGPVVALCSYF
ncbi:MAG: hypothetical protein K0Q50_2010, partial [Vampirovibrio sp.]|nr:hypothetical protein [Vampirovibrio sp.]